MMGGGGAGGGCNSAKRQRLEHSETTFSACLAQRTRMSSPTPRASDSSLLTATKPPCVNVSLPLTHPLLSAPCQHIIQLLCHVILCLHTLICSSAAHTHKVRGTFCEAPVLFFSSALVSGAGGDSFTPLPLLSGSSEGSVGARRDGFVQLQFQRRRAELQAAVAGPADAAGLKQLLAWHWDLLVAAAGAEHVAAVPAGRHGRRVTAGPCARTSLHLQLACVCSAYHLDQLDQQQGLARNYLHIFNGSI